MILVIDNYDSFVHNLARHLRRLGVDTRVVRNDAITIAEIEQSSPLAIVLSPGPCTPDQAGICLDVVAKLGHSYPLLGICLGHQVMIQALGGTIDRSGEPMHGRSSPIFHDGSELFRGVPNPFTAGRYHSLIGAADRIPDVLQVTARTGDGTVMAIEHQQLPLVGWQFHPESILTECGYQLLQNFLHVAGIDAPHGRPALDQLGASEFDGPRHESARPYELSPRLSRQAP